MSRNWLEFKRNYLPVVPVRIDNERYLALIDSGALYSFVAPHLSLLLGLQRKRFQAIVGVSGHQEMLPLITLPSIGLAQIEVAPCEAVVRNLRPLGLNVELILGVNAFKNQRLQFDFKEGRIFILD